MIKRTKKNKTKVWLIAMFNHRNPHKLKKKKKKEISVQERKNTYNSNLFQTTFKHNKVCKFQQVNIKY